MRISKQLAKAIQERPDWVAKDRDWSIFTDYRDSKQSADDLAVLWGLSRAQVQNIVRNIVERYNRPGELSNRAVKVLKNCGVSFDPSKLQADLKALESKAGGKDVAQYLLDNQVGVGCGRKTSDEIRGLYESMQSDRAMQPSA